MNDIWLGLGHVELRRCHDIVRGIRILSDLYAEKPRLQCVSSKEGQCYTNPMVLK